MQPASRAALAKAREQLVNRINDPGTASARERSRVGDDLGGVAAVLGEQPAIRRHLADSAAPQQVRRTMVEALFGAQVSQVTRQILGDVVALRWSRPRDLVDGIEELAWQVLLTVAEQTRSLEDVEDELFRFGRILAAQPRLVTLLGEQSAPVARRLQLLNTVLAGRTRPVTRKLVEQAVRAPRGRRIHEIVDVLVDRAAARRQRSVAQVSAAGPLSPQQEQRLIDVLNRIYRRPISLKIDLDPELLGGLVIRVGDEVIDGSVAARLAQARQWISR
ncbi:MAG: F0F1 ATP synthase subunit delta [Pseudonocardiaceae bacterium]